MIPSIDNSKITFSRNFSRLGKTDKALDKFLQSQENLSSTRFIQGTLTNWLPKAILSRSFVDFSEFTFLEFLESGIFYFAAPFFGEKLFRNGIFKKIQPKNKEKEIIENLSRNVSNIKKSTLDKELKNRIITTKGGILTACIAIPVMEYALGFAKNLFTLKVFKVSDFNNVANLKKDKTEDIEQQQRVESHSKNVLKKSAIAIIGSLAAGLSLSRFGYKSAKITKFCEGILNPGEKISNILHRNNLHSNKTDKFLKEYLKFDFEERNGKLALSKGQLAVICTTGLFGYSSAAKDRGKLDFYEIWTRVPLVVLYTIFGSALLDSGFKKYLAKKGKFPELIKQNNDGSIAPTPTRNELPKIAEKISKQNNTNFDRELSKLIRQKSVITGVPYLFAIAGMGFTLSAITRFWTQYRYNKQHKNEQKTIEYNQHYNPVFSGFKI